MKESVDIPVGNRPAVFIGKKIRISVRDKDFADHQVIVDLHCRCPGYGYQPVFAELGLFYVYGLPVGVWLKRFFQIQKEQRIQILKVCLSLYPRPVR